MKKWNDMVFQRAIELKKENYSYESIKNILNEEFDLTLSYMSIKKKFHNEGLTKKNQAIAHFPNNNELQNIEQNIKYNPDGTISQSEFEVKMSFYQKENKTAKDILKYKGYNVEEWEILHVTTNEWTTTTSDGQKWNQQLKFTVKPKNNFLNLDKLIKKINKSVRPIHATKQMKTGDKYLVVPLFDLHFGNNSFEDYEDSLIETTSIIGNGYKEILILLGGDLLHNDNHRGTTSSGTVIGKVDMDAAWADAYDYIYAIINAALVNATTVKVIYSFGNHDEMTGQTLVFALQRVFEKEFRLTIDAKHESFKAYLLGHNFIGLTHGDKSSWKKYPMIFASTFALLWGCEGVCTREIYTGHLHFEAYKDLDGLMIRQAPTMNAIDSWHKENGFVTAHKRFELVEYEEYKPKTIFYV